MERLSIKIKDQDNVVVAVHDLPAGTTLESGVVTREKIPQAHKIALVAIPACLLPSWPPGASPRRRPPQRCWSGRPR